MILREWVISFCLGCDDKNLERVLSGEEGRMSKNV